MPGTEASIRRVSPAPVATQLLGLVLVLAATGAILAGMGRTWWCDAGDSSLWSGDIWSRHNSQHLADPYTITHVLHGIVLYGILWAVLGSRFGPAVRLAAGVAVEAIWEIAENTDTMIERYREVTISLDYYGDSIVNSLGDIVAFVLGYFAAAALPVWVSVAAFVSVDAALVVWIRDSLVLNVVMLLYPLESVKAWQLGGAG